MSRKASGLKAWAIQRLTAIYIGLFAIYLVLALMFAAPADYAAWKAWIGVRDVLIDYLHPIAIRATVLGLVALSLVAMGLWAAQALILVRLV